MSNILVTNDDSLRLSNLWVLLHYLGKNKENKIFGLFPSKDVSGSGGLKSQDLISTSKKEIEKDLINSVRNVTFEELEKFFGTNADWIVVKKLYELEKEAFDKILNNCYLFDGYPADIQYIAENHASFKAIKFDKIISGPNFGSGIHHDHYKISSTAHAVNDFKNSEKIVLNDAICGSKGDIIGGMNSYFKKSISNSKENTECQLEEIHKILEQYSRQLSEYESLIENFKTKNRYLDLSNTIFYFTFGYKNESLKLGIPLGCKMNEESSNILKKSFENDDVSETKKIIDKKQKQLVEKIEKLNKAPEKNNKAKLDNEISIIKNDLENLQKYEDQNQQYNTDCNCVSANIATLSILKPFAEKDKIYNVTGNRKYVSAEHCVDDEIIQKFDRFLTEQAKSPSSEKLQILSADSQEGLILD